MKRIISKAAGPFPLPAFGLLKAFFIVGLLLAQSASAVAFGPKREFVKTINREFGTTAKGTTALYNKYGVVKVKTWGNNSVKIDITITVNTESQRDADAMFDRIQVNFTSTSGYIKAETMVNQDNWWPKTTNACQDFKINYEVYMPASNQLDLKNKYGNSFVTDLKGKLSAEIKYGDLRAEVIDNDVDLYLSYGKAYMTKVNNVNGQVSYGELHLTEARDLQLDTKYSDINVERAANLRITSKYDDFQLGTVEDLRLQTKYADVKVKNVRSAYLTTQYTDLKIGSLTDVLDADQSYGGLKVEMLGKNASEVSLVGKYTDFNIALDRGAPFRFDLESRHADLKVPNGATIRQREDGSNRRVVKGYVGDANAKGMVKARMDYGNFVLR